MNETYAVIENTYVTNVVIATPEYASQFPNWVLLEAGFGIGDMYVNGHFEHPPQE